MVRSELVTILSARADVTQIQAEEVVEFFFAEIVKAMTTEGRVEVRGFGSFSVRKYRSYEGRNPKTGETIAVAQKKLPFFKPGLELRQESMDSMHSDRLP